MFEMMDPSDDQHPADPPVPPDDDGGLIPVDDLADDAWLDPALQDQAAQVVTDLEDQLAAEEFGELDADGTLAEADAARLAVIRAETRLLEVAAHWADLHPVADAPVGVPGGERLIRVGGDGTPEVAEFAVAELGVVLQVGDAAAVRLVGDALDLRHRLPALWAIVQAGGVHVWRARQTADRTRSLSKEAASRVDATIADLAGTLTGRRLSQLVTKAILEADPPQALTDAAQAKADSGVFLSPDVEHGYATMIIKAKAGDVDAFDQALDLVARALKTLGDPDSLQQRRATAVAVLADPTTALDLIAQADTKRKAESERAAARRTGDTDLAEILDQKVDRRRFVFGSAVVYYHLTKTQVDAILGGHQYAGAAVGRVEGIGPVILDQITGWLRHTNVTLKPVIDLDQVAPVDCYQAPARISEAIRLRHPADYFPYGTSLSRHQDDEHVIPYVPINKGGPPGQTDPAKMAEITRRHHRVKTFAGWTVKQLKPGAWLWRTRHGYHFLVDQHGTTALGRL